MKRCPTCNQTFDEDWLSFCTNDGTTLIENSPATSEPAPTIMSPAPPPPSNPSEPANWNSPSGWDAPSGGFGYGQFPAQQRSPPVWEPPRPPAYDYGPTQGMAVASLVTGIFSITIGLCCYLGVISSPVAICLGIYSINQIKNSPDKFTGRPFAIAGIVMGTLYFLFVALIILLYGALAMVHGIK
jgi:hypothetical protein